MSAVLFRRNGLLRFQLLLATIIALYCTPNSRAQEAPEGGNDCLVDGIMRRSGKTFELRCTGVCQCYNGNIGCVSMCPPFVMPPGCRTLKRAGACCRLGHCPSQAEKAACETSSEVLSTDLRSPWLLRMTVKNASKESQCTAVLMDQKSVFASPDCSEASASQIIYPASAVGASIVQSTLVPTNRDEARILRLRLSGIDDSDIELTREFHEINIPDKEICSKFDCTLFIGAYSPLSTKFQVIRAMHAQSSQCQITEADAIKGMKCLEIRGQDYPECINMAGGVVFVKSNDYPFLKGFMVQDPFQNKDASGCDTEGNRFKHYYDICSYLSSNAANSN